MKKIIRRAGLVALVGLSTPLAAQDAAEQEVRGDGSPWSVYDDTVYDGDWVTVGVGGIYGPSYDGSDDYVFSGTPALMGNVGGITISPRAGGVALDFVPAPENGNVDFNAGVSVRLVRDRVSKIKDPVVASLGKLDTAFEVGPTAGVRFLGVLHQYDSLSINADARWDVAGAHDGMVVSPSVTYFTPLSRGIASGLSLGTDYVDNDYADYYFSVTPAQTLTSGLATYDADGGFKNASATMFLGFDLDGDLTNGGFLVGLFGSYSRMLGDFKKSPFVDTRGDANQWTVGGGVGYTF